MVQYEFPDSLLELLPRNPPPSLPPGGFLCSIHLIEENEYVYPNIPREQPECQKCLTEKIECSVLEETQEEVPSPVQKEKKRKCTLLCCCWKVTKCTYSCYKCAGCLLLTLTIIGVFLWIFILIESEKRHLIQQLVPVQNDEMSQKDDGVHDK